MDTLTPLLGACGGLRPKGMFVAHSVVDCGDSE